MRMCYVVGTTTKTKDTSTTLDLAVESVMRGHEVSFLDVRRFEVRHRDIYGGVKRVRERVTERSDLSELLRHAHYAPLNLMDLDVVFIRCKPTERSQTYYDSALKFLTILKKRKNAPYMLNNPEAISTAPSKLVLKSHQLISDRVDSLYHFCMQELGGNAVAKSFSDQSSGGEDVHFLDQGNQDEWKKILGGLRGKGYVIVQPYLPNTGDVRVLLLEGEPIGCYQRVNSEEGKVKHNIAQGAEPVPYQLTSEDQQLIQQYRPYIIRNGLDFVGMDILTGSIHSVTELNAHNPGVQLE